jgi:hypothetical protein
MSGRRWKFQALVIMGILLLAACSGQPSTPIIPTDILITSTPTFTAADYNGEAIVLYQSADQVVYTYQYDPADLEAAHLCLSQDGQPGRFLDQTGEGVRWFTNAVVSDDGQTVVYTRYLRQTDLVEIWAVGFNGGESWRLVDSDTFVGLAQGFARAIPQQMLALPNNKVVFNTSEFGYKTDRLDDLHLLDLDSGQLTTLLQPGEGGQFSWSADGEYILIEREDGTLALDVHSLEITPASPETLSQGYSEPTATVKVQSLQDCPP